MNSYIRFIEKTVQTFYILWLIVPISFKKKEWKAETTPFNPHDGLFHLPNHI